MKRVFGILLFCFLEEALSSPQSSSTICQNGRSDCEASVYRSGKDIVFEISCKCKRRKDVYEFLNYLQPVKCQHVPNEPSQQVDLSILRIEGCDVKEREFPEELLRVLRRSKKLKILLDDAANLRIPTNYNFRNETIQPVIDAKFSNSHVPGMGSGWFNFAKNVSLEVNNCSIGVMEIGLLGNYEDGAVVKVLIENSDIGIIKSNAVGLPSTGEMTFRGGRISQVEKDAFQGGHFVHLEGVRIASIQNGAVNLHGLRSFKMESCLVAKVAKEALVEQLESGLDDADHGMDKVSIRGNKFVSLHGDAFTGICRAKSLIFEDNFIYHLESPLQLESNSSCLSRSWESSLWNNGFNCNFNNTKCEFFEQKTDQACALYSTSWCLCHNLDLDDEMRDDSKENIEPCRKPLISNIKTNCPTANISFLDHCKAAMDRALEVSGKILYLHSSSETVRTSLSCQLLSILFVIKIQFPIHK